MKTKFGVELLSLYVFNNFNGVVILIASSEMIGNITIYNSTRLSLYVFDLNIHVGDILAFGLTKCFKSDTPDGLFVDVPKINNRTYFISTWKTNPFLLLIYKIMKAFAKWTIMLQFLEWSLILCSLNDDAKV